MREQDKTYTNVTEADRKYRLRFFLREVQDQFGVAGREEFIETACVLCDCSRRKLEYYLLAYVGQNDRKYTAPFAYMLVLASMFSSWLGRRVGIHELYHPQVPCEELGIFTESSSIAT